MLTTNSPTLQRLDDAWEGILGERQGNKSSENLLASAHIFNGYYTLTFPDFSHRTFKIWTKRPATDFSSNFMAGKRILGMLIGPDNTSDWEPMAFVEADGFKVWKRFKNTRQEHYAQIIWEIINGETVAGCELLVSKRCLMCGRELTEPDSIERGIGSTCWQKMGNKS